MTDEKYINEGMGEVFEELFNKAVQDESLLNKELEDILTGTTSRKHDKDYSEYVSF